jgi:Fur family transcriptional regulator, ferric uptake regulator
MAMRVDADLHSLVEGRLRKAELRYTSGRRAIVEALAEMGGPASIEDLARLQPSVARSSAYRHLVDLQTAGVVRRIAADDGFGRFELSEDITEHHHHLLCSSCGRVTDMTPSPAFERNLSRYLDEMARAGGFVPLGHRVDVVGLCDRCH